jgi:hypothetical protein
MRTGHALFLAMLSFALVSSAQAQTRVSFRAIVHVGESYAHPIGHGLVFSIDQEDQGSWNFQVKPSQENSDDYTACLDSPVLHGPSTTDLLAWRFVADADAGYIEQLPARKTFSFILTAADQKYECANQNAMYESFQRSQGSGKEGDYSGLPDYRPRPVAHGTAVIESVMLKPNQNGNNSEFQEVTMRVVIRYPHRKRTSSASRTRAR